MSRLVPISEAAKLLGVSIQTLRRWEAEGRLIPEHTTGKHRRYDMLKLKPELFRAAADNRKTLAYVRVSSHDQKLEIIAVFSARLYGSRSRKNKKLLDGIKQAVEDSLT